MQITLHPIATVTNTRTTPSDDFWGSVISEITLLPDIPEATFQGLATFSHDKMTINSLAGNFTGISRPAVSKHIRVLHEAGLIAITDQGRERICELRENGFEEIKNWLIFFDQFWKEKLQNLEDLLNKRANNNNEIH